MSIRITQIVEEQNNFMKTLSIVLNIIDDVATDERLFNSEYLDLMNKLKELSEYKSQFVTTTMYRELRRAYDNRQTRLPKKEHTFLDKMKDDKNYTTCEYCYGLYSKAFINNHIENTAVCKTKRQLISYIDESKKHTYIKLENGLKVNILTMNCEFSKILYCRYTSNIPVMLTNINHKLLNIDDKDNLYSYKKIRNKKVFTHNYYDLYDNRREEIEMGLEDTLYTTL